jgi:predicted MPP superfamily phosphohydrolase
MLDRRSFLLSAGAIAACPSPLESADTRFRFAVIADTHIIDEFYRGPEGSPEDTESIFKTTERLRRTREQINALRPAMDLTFLVGDYFHNYPSDDIDYFFQHKTRLDAAKELTDGFAMPVHAGFGNHDYDVPRMSRENSHELFRRKFRLKPYYSVDHKDFKFVHVNNFLGATWDPKHARYDKSKGSLGEEQLNWFEAELEQRKPTFVFVHFPMIIIEPDERAGYGLHGIIKKHRDTVRHVISGHWHKWFEFGRSYGPPHLVIAATRYDPNAYLIVEADGATGEHRLLNIDHVDWNTHFLSSAGRL